MTKCNKCQICSFVTPGKVAKSTATNFKHDICQKVNCQDRNIIYLIGCSHCRMQYVGESERTLKERFSDHKGYVANHHLNKATGFHFNLPGHKIHHMTVTILEKIHSRSPQIRKTRESMFIEQFNTKYKGMNQKT